MRNFTRKYFHILSAMMLAALITACGSERKNPIESSSDPSVYYNHSVAFLGTALYSWGANTYGQLGSGDENNSDTRYLPAQVTGAAATGMAGVSAGGTHILAYNSSPGNVYAWGNNGSGQLGNNSTAANATPVLVISDATTTPATLLSGVTAVSAGARHSLAIAGGNVWAWGSNTDGQLGLAASTPPQSTAAQITSLASVTRIAAGGGGHSLALSGGLAWSWGRNSSGQLGRTTTTPATPGTVVKGDATNLSPLAEIAAGRSHSLFLLGDETVWSCGYNLVGELGDGTTTNSTHAVQVLTAPGVPLTGATAIAAGLDHSLALVNNEVWAWGLNNYGQLGNGAPLTGSILQTSTVAVRVLINATTPLPGIVKIVAIGNHSLAVDNIGQLWVWGYNGYGQLGQADKDTTIRNYATRVPGFSANSRL